MKKFNVLDVVKLGKEKLIQYYLESERKGDYFLNTYRLVKINDNGTCTLLLMEITEDSIIGKEIIVADSADVFALPYYSTDLECEEFLSQWQENFRKRIQKDNDNV